jgi:hypothetical protein
MLILQKLEEPSSLMIIKEVPAERIDTAHAGARALQVIAHCIHHGPDHGLLYETADAYH